MKYRATLWSPAGGFVHQETKDKVPTKMRNLINTHPEAAGWADGTIFMPVGSFALVIEKIEEGETE